LKEIIGRGALALWLGGTGDGMHRWNAAMQEASRMGGRKMFFFEKKNQKTLIPSPSPAIRHRSHHTYVNRRKFFGSFFQKRTAFFLS
jgi:hypothetical protein